MLREHSRTQNKLKQDLGDLVLSALSDEEIYEVLLNPDGVLWVDGYQGKREYGVMSAAAAKNLINTVASVSDEIVTAKNPSFSGELWVLIDEEFKLFRFQARERFNRLSSRTQVALGYRHNQGTAYSHCFA